MGTVVSFAVAEASPRTTENGSALTGAEPSSGPLGPDAVLAALARAQAGLRWTDRVFSTWKAKSPVSRLRRGEIEIEQAPPEVAEVLALCRRARDASDGWFDPWSMPGGVDPTGLVKGWAAQRALDEFRRAGLPGAMINAGGDIAVYGEPEPGQPWRVGIRDPRDESRLILTVELAGAGAVATSGVYERGDHLLTPVTHAPARGLLSATVVGHDLAFADALATALFASGGRLLPRLGRLAGYHGLIVDAAGVPHTSPGLRLTLPVAV
jgi:FAD:protein FMN transferase